MSKQNSGFRHYRYSAAGRITTKGGITMAFNSPKHIADLTAADTVQVAFSFCSGCDNFNRTEGRAIAVGRLDATNGLSIPGNEFQALIHTSDPTDISCKFGGFDYEQFRSFNSLVKSTTPTC